MRNTGWQRAWAVWMMAALTGCCLTAAVAAAPLEVVLARGGQALVPVVVSEQASERVKQAATDLATILQAMSGAQFRVEAGDGRQGLAVGTAGQLGALVPGSAFAPSDSLRREEYLLRSHAGGVYLIGATEQAVEHAVWDFLYRLGYRQFFPGKTWEVVPRLPEVKVALDTRQAPAYHARRIWYGYGTWPENRAGYEQWCTRNRAVAGLALNTGHVYEEILHRHPEEFKAHPEWLGLIKGERTGSKFCISNPGLRELVVKYLLGKLEKDPTLDSVSCEPSDGGAWCECPECAKIGTPSDRAVLLANTVAEAVAAKYPGVFVGMYAYNEHSPAPNLKVHPRVIISCATSFIRGGTTIEAMLSDWQKQGATIGIREYYSVNTWDRDLPGAARGGNPEYLARTIPDFHSRGARFLTSEASENWAPNGLGYYLAARMLWDLGEAKRVEELTQDFLDRAFGPAAKPMAEYYKLLDGAHRPRLSADLLGRMYGHLKAARALSSDERVLARLDDLTLYTRYVELYRSYSGSVQEGRQAAFEALLRHAYRMRGTGMVHSLGLWRDLDSRDSAVAIPEPAAWNKPEPGNPWKSSATFTREELDALLAAGLAANPQRGFESVAYTRRLKPASGLQLGPVATGSTGTYGRHTQRFYTYFSEPAELVLKVTGGLITHYRDRGDVRVVLRSVSGDNEKEVARGTTPPDGEERVIVLKAQAPGLHVVEISDGGDATRVIWPDGVPCTVESSEAHPATLYGRWQMVFYVPKGTKVVGGFSDGDGQLCDSTGKMVLKLPNAEDYFRVEVPAGEDGKLWSFRQAQGQKLLLTVPPYMARNEKELLLPEEVLRADGH